MNDLVSFNHWIGYIFAADFAYADAEAEAGRTVRWGLPDSTLQTMGVDLPENPSQAIMLFRRHFWMRPGCNDMVPFVAWTYADALLNHEPDEACVLLQHGLGFVNPDGVLCSATREAAADTDMDLGAYWRRYRERRIALLLDQRRNALGLLHVGLNKLCVMAEFALRNGVLR